MRIFLSLVLQSKKRFEREWREAERAAQYAEKTDQDINATKADVEKVTEAKLAVSPPRVSHAAKSSGGCWRSAEPCLLASHCFQAKQQAHMRAHVAEECKNDYAAQLQKFNKEQSQFYFSDMPLIFNVRKWNGTLGWRCRCRSFRKGRRDDVCAKSDSF